MRRRTIFQLAASGAVIATLWHDVQKQDSFLYWLAEKAVRAEDSGTRNVEISIDWATVVANSTPLTFGSNDFQVTSIKKATDPEYRNLLEEVGFGLIRIHHAKISDRWTNQDAKTWDVAKIKTIYEAYSGNKATIVQNIPNWAKWMETDDNGLLNPKEYDNYAAFCAELVKIINGQLNHQVMYWEPLNEQDNRYHKAGKLDELWRIYNLVAQAMKAQDPRIKLGGPVLTWDNSGRLAGFLEACKDNVDFISWHRYASGNAEDSTYNLMSYTPNYGEQVRRFRQITQQYIPDRKLPLFLGEYNINYSWQSGETRQHTHIGGVWFASVLKHLAEAGVDMAASWNIKDGVYGLIDPANKMRPAAQVFAWAIKYLTGEVIKTDTSHSLVEAMAVKQGGEKRSLLLINKSVKPASLKVDGLSGINNSQPLPIFYLDKNGVRETTITLDSLFNKPLPAYSLALLHLGRISG
ncbi:MAG: alpha-L-arabinofuranosidase [Nostocaceae cyanobacterium]|nr:alpha-L-arabinofuranosidase [Nostocaceae cyanobacterium]